MNSASRILNNWTMSTEISAAKDIAQYYFLQSENKFQHPIWLLAPPHDSVLHKTEAGIELREIAYICLNACNIEFHFSWGRVQIVLMQIFF